MRSVRSEMNVPGGTKTPLVVIGASKETQARVARHGDTIKRMARLDDIDTARRHVDKWRISFEWSLESVFAVGLATAGASALGGYVVDTFGFQVLFIAASIVSIVSALILATMKDHLLQREEAPKVFPERPHHKK